LLAYTNRAVDEICDAVNTAIFNFNFENDENNLVGNFLRIGQEIATAPRHRGRLLEKLAEKVKSRLELKQLLAKHRIVVGTVASVLAKPDVFKLKNFDTVIVDEASQIVEPQMIGILPLVKKFILIGDHKQLPAIVQQSSLLSKVNEPELNQIGLNDMRNSYFERIIGLAIKNGWTHAYHQLTRQGRMHSEIMHFSNVHFYEAKLQTLSQDGWQYAPIHFKKIDTHNKLESTIATNRLLFIPSQREEIDKSDKINLFEAKKVVELIKAVRDLYLKNDLPFSPEKTIGVITPFRNQISLIKTELEKANIPNTETITIDTVERYQGSQRDIIIISLCMNERYQLNSLTSYASDGITDRKLNVALTRARQQLFLIGNKDVLRQDKNYRSLIEYIESKKNK
jgi:DNA replication ATP-dependent helicase Dna2